MQLSTRGCAASSTRLGAAPDCTFTLRRQHLATEEHIRSSGLEWTFLQDAMYLDAIPLFPDEDSVIRGNSGHGRTGFVSRDDVADAAVAVLTGDGHEGQAYRLMGPEAISLQSANTLTKVTGRPAPGRSRPRRGRNHRDAARR